MLRLRATLYLFCKFEFYPLLRGLLHRRLLASGRSLADGWHLTGEQAGNICGDLLPVLIEQPPEAVLPRRLLAVVPLLRVPHNLVLLVSLNGKEGIDPLSVAVRGAYVRLAL